MPKNLDPTGRKPPRQPKVRTLTPRPAPAPARKLKLATRDPCRRRG
jgi:hypothetical protein